MSCYLARAIRVRTAKSRFRQLVDSIREFGFVNPVLVDADGAIVAGHGRVAAANLLGVATVPTIMARPHRRPEAGLHPGRQQAGRKGGLGPRDPRHRTPGPRARSRVRRTITGFEVAEIDLCFWTMRSTPRIPGPRTRLPACPIWLPRSPGPAISGSSAGIACSAAMRGMPPAFDALMAASGPTSCSPTRPTTCRSTAMSAASAAIRHRPFAMGVGEMSSAGVYRLPDGDVGSRGHGRARRRDRLRLHGLAAYGRAGRPPARRCSAS